MARLLMWGMTFLLVLVALAFGVSSSLMLNDPPYGDDLSGPHFLAYSLDLDDDGSTVVLKTYGLEMRIPATLRSRHFGMRCPRRRSRRVSCQGRSTTKRD